MSKHVVYTTKVYQKQDGKIPYQDWLSKLKDRKAAIAILRRFSKTLTSGSMGDIKPIKGSQGIYEFRNHMGPGYRVYCLIHQEDVIILMCGGDKSTQDKDIKRAEEYRNDILQRGISNSSL